MFLCGPSILVVVELESFDMLVFVEVEKQENRAKNLREKREPTANLTHIWHWGQASAHP